MVRVVARLPPASSTRSVSPISPVPELGMVVGGACAGIAGMGEVAGPIGQLLPIVSPGYGFAAIIVAFVGRLHPIGIVFSAILMSMFYIGGELAQSRLGLPKSLTGVFQGLLLFTLLACDTLIAYRIRWKPSRATPAPPPAIDGASASPVVSSAALPAREGT